MKPLTCAQLSEYRRFTNASVTRARSILTPPSSVPYFSRLAIRHGMIQACATPPAAVANEQLLPDLTTTEALRLVMRNLCEE